MPLGKGLVLHRQSLGREDAEMESLDAIAWGREQIRKTDAWQVAIELPTPVLWEQWGNGGGVTNAATKLGGSALANIETVAESRIHASAILQEGGGFPVLFVLNHYPDAAVLDIVFRSLRPKALVHLVSGETIPVTNGRATVDTDRKAGEVYRLEM